MDEKTDTELKLPEAQDGFVKTMNNTGFMTTYLDRFSQAFVDYAGAAKLPVMDVGAAYGVATLAALEKGATVIANDIDERHLQILLERVPEKDRARVRLLPGAFPQISVEPNSVAAVLVSRVLHFFDPQSVELSARSVHDWLAPGGKVFIVCETPFVGTLTGFLDEYERRKSEGDPWPGLIMDLMKYTPTAVDLPKLGNRLDTEVLTRVFSAAGFTIEDCAYIPRPEFPQFLQLDGRESVGLVGRKG